jgi:hypothetical protein
VARRDANHAVRRQRRVGRRQADFGTRQRTGLAACRLLPKLCDHLEVCGQEPVEVEEAGPKLGPQDEEDGELTGGGGDDEDEGAAEAGEGGGRGRQVVRSVSRSAEVAGQSSEGKGQKLGMCHAGEDPQAVVGALGNDLARESLCELEVEGEDERDEGEEATLRGSCQDLPGFQVARLKGVVMKAAKDGKSNAEEAQAKEGAEAGIEGQKGQGNEANARVLLEEALGLGRVADGGARELSAMSGVIDCCDDSQ